MLAKSELHLLQESELVQTLTKVSGFILSKTNDIYVLRFQNTFTDCEFRITVHHIAKTNDNTFLILNV